MNDAIRHYHNLLAEYYTWMIGTSFEVKVSEQQELLERLGLTTGLHGAAVDLGAGPGYQSAALSNLGFRPVLAVDTSAALLAELDRHRAQRAIEGKLGDMRALVELVAPASIAAIVCMGDTLTHLESVGEVSALFRDSFAALQRRGRLVLTFRDYSTELIGLDRFIPVRSDANRVMTCFLEYQSARVVVHDLVSVRSGGEWTLRKSSYPKLRLAPATVAHELGAAGFEIVSNSALERMWAVVAQKPTPSSDV
jgi:hypothetical protein